MQLFKQVDLVAKKTIFFRKEQEKNPASFTDMNNHLTKQQRY